MTHLSIFLFYLFPILNTYTQFLLLPSTHLIFPSEMNLPLIQECAAFENLNQKLSNSSLSMLIPSSFQQLKSSCLKDPLILHKFPPSAKQASLGNSCKEGNMCLLPALPPAFPQHAGSLLSTAAQHPPPGVIPTHLHSLACQPQAPQPTQGHSHPLLPQPQITWLYVSLTYKPPSRLRA